jgi:formate hydrogenlyase subunit 3/multisubunit Na+/H+ antiporter MnhD subunit
METDPTQEYYINEEMDDSFLQPEDAKQKDLELEKNPHKNQQKNKGRGSFADGLAAGLGIGSIACFAIVWLALFLSPLLPQSASYENLLATFIYLLVFLLASGLIALTAGVVREYYPKTKS